VLVVCYICNVFLFFTGLGLLFLLLVVIGINIINEVIRILFHGLFDFLFRSIEAFIVIFKKGLFQICFWGFWLGLLSHTLVLITKMLRNLQIFMSFSTFLFGFAF